MLQFLIFLIGLIGSSVAAAYDLKTTEIPDQLPIAIALIGLAIYGYQSYTLHDIWPISNSILYGGSFLAFGFILYYFGQWGGGDAELLAAMGFLLAGFRGEIPFPLVYFVNVFLVGAIYMIGYAVVFSLKNRRIYKRFKQDAKRYSKGIAVILLVLTITSFFVSMIFLPLLTSLEIVIVSDTVSLAVYLLWFFARAVEEVGFKRKVAVNKLKVGDVLLSSKKWVGLTEKELKRIKRSGKKYVWIKEGVRFAPAFPLALLVSYYLGLWIFW